MSKNKIMNTEPVLTKELYDYITGEVKAFKEWTKDYHHGLTEHDIIHTLFYPNEFLNDWDEGPYNDPFWDKEGNQHSVFKLVRDTIVGIEQRTRSEGVKVGL